MSSGDVEERLAAVHRQVAEAGRAVNDALTFRKLRPRELTGAADKLKEAAEELEWLLAEQEKRR